MVADRTTKALLTVIAVCLVILCGNALSQPSRIVHGAGVTNPLQFSADKDRFYFFDPSTMKVYSYPTVGGNPQSAVQLERLGGELRPAPTY